MPNAAGFDRRSMIAMGSALDMRGAAVSEAVAAASRLSARGQDAGATTGKGAGANREQIVSRGCDKKR